jgi:hypothetical protein
MRKFNFLLSLVFVLSGFQASAQTNPTPHDLAAGNFSFTGFTDDESTVYPVHTQGWRFGVEPISATVSPGTDDRVLVGQSVSAGQGNIRNEGANGISFRNSGSNHIGALAVALDATGRENLRVSYTVEDILEDASRQNGMLLQYRIGEVGNFITIAGTTYLSDPEGLEPAANFSEVDLPEVVNGEALVQVRWLYFYEAGGGTRDRIKLDEISISSEEGEVISTEIAVTFRVDMSEFTGTIQPEGMHIAGSFPTNTWTPGARPMNDQGDGTWTWTEMMEPGFALEFKFVRGDDWPAGDENMGGLPCSASGTTNRAITIPAESTILPAVCYNSCNPCDVVAETSEITFQVDMSQQTIAAEGVGISGSFNGFTFEPMADQGAGIYSLTLSIEQGITVEYKFRNGDEFESPPAECGTGGFSNRQLTIPDSDLTLGVVCYSGCEACADPGDTFELTLSVDASQIDIDPAGVHIAGNFNGFSPTAMEEAGNGIYFTTVTVAAGATALWKYLNGASFVGAETVPEACGEPDGFEGFNRSFLMAEENAALSTVCFAACEACDPVAETYTLTFQVDASAIVVDAAGVHIAGSFNGFTPQTMNNAGGGIYTFSVEVEGGATVLWKYLNGPTFDGQESVPAACGEDDDFGGFNRAFIAPEADIELGVVCFGSCTACVPDFVSNADRQKFNIFPNPNDGSFSLVSPKSGTATVRIFDLSGRMVHQKILPTIEGDVILYNNAILEEGYYLIELRYGQEVFTSRIVVE